VLRFINTVTYSIPLSKTVDFLQMLRVSGLPRKSSPLPASSRGAGEGEGLESMLLRVQSCRFKEIGSLTPTLSRQQCGRGSVAHRRRPEPRRSTLSQGEEQRRGSSMQKGGDPRPDNTSP
jgi:hypothetical protein